MMKIGKWLFFGSLIYLVAFALIVDTSKDLSVFLAMVAIWALPGGFVLIMASALRLERTQLSKR